MRDIAVNRFCPSSRKKRWIGSKQRFAITDIFDLERGKKDADRLKVCTAFNGTRVEPGLRGSITNIGEDNFTPESLTYGVLEGMARELYDMYCLMREGTDLKAERLVASGNGLRMNPVLQEICSSMFGAELILADFKEEAACGAAVSGTMVEEKETGEMRF